MCSTPSAFAPCLLQLWPHIVLMAYGMVIINAAVLAPFILFVLGFSSRGWNWIQGAVLAAMLAPTDAVAGGWFCGRRMLSLGSRGALGKVAEDAPPAVWLFQSVP